MSDENSRNLLVDLILDMNKAITEEGPLMYLLKMSALGDEALRLVSESLVNLIDNGINQRDMTVIHNALMTVSVLYGHACSTMAASTLNDSESKQYLNYLKELEKLYAIRDSKASKGLDRGFTSEEQPEVFYMGVGDSEDVKPN